MGTELGGGREDEKGRLLKWRGRPSSYKFTRVDNEGAFESCMEHRGQEKMRPTVAGRPGWRSRVKKKGHRVNRGPSGTEDPNVETYGRDMCHFASS